MDKVNRNIAKWFNSDERQFILNALEGISDSKKVLLKNLQDYKRYDNGTVNEWKKTRGTFNISGIFHGEISFGDLWKLLCGKQKKYEKILLRCDNGEPFEKHFTETDSTNTQTLDIAHSKADNEAITDKICNDIPELMDKDTSAYQASIILEKQSREKYGRKLSSDAIYKRWKRREDNI